MKKIIVLCVSMLLFVACEPLLNLMPGDRPDTDLSEVVSVKLEPLKQVFSPNEKITIHLTGNLNTSSYKNGVFSFCLYRGGENVTHIMTIENSTAACTTNDENKYVLNLSNAEISAIDKEIPFFIGESGSYCFKVWLNCPGKNEKNSSYGRYYKTIYFSVEE